MNLNKSNAGWRENAEKGRWDRIDTYGMTEDDRLDLKEVLEEIVPTRIYGDGVETYTDYIQPNEATTRQIQDACDLLGQLRITRHHGRPTDYRESDETPARWLAVQCATEVLLENGIVFEGWWETYVYRQKGGRLMARISSKSAKVLGWQ